MVPTPVFLPGEAREQRSLEGYSPRVTRSWTWLSDQHCYCDHFQKAILETGWHFLKKLNIHIVVQQKPTQHYKAITLQLKLKKNCLMLNIELPYELATLLLSIYTTPWKRKQGLKKILAHRCFIFIYFFVATQCGMWDLSSLTRDRSPSPCRGSVES